jgi:uncharacterized protein YbjT (DUF2867 family)
MAEKVFVTGATGSIGSHTVQRLVESGVFTTAYVRDTTKASELFAKELETGKLSFVQGDYENLEAFKTGIVGHARLLLMVADVPKIPHIKSTFAKIAYASGVKQIVDISSFSVELSNRTTISYYHTRGEELVRKLAEDTGNTFVALRGVNYMSNALFTDNRTIKNLNKLRNVGSPDTVSALSDTRDIGDVAAAVLSDPIEKHGFSVYQITSEVLSNKQRAEIYSRVLGREIVYEQVSVSEAYEKMIGHMPHTIVYDILSYSLENQDWPTPQITTVTKRPLRTFENWVQDNRSHFE